MVKMEWALEKLRTACILLWLSTFAHIIGGQTRREPWGRVTSGEYCDYESFRAQCNSGEIIQVISAHYGHIKVGKCVKKDLGYIGCKADVLSIFDRVCGGKQGCQISVNDGKLRDTRPCETGLSLFLDVSYACVKALPQQTVCNSMQAQVDTQYISSQQLYNSGCQSYQSPKITAQKGQKISLAMITLSSTEHSSHGTFGVIVDDTSQGQFTLSPTAEKTTWQSETSSVSILLDDGYEQPRFLIEYQAVGCPEVTPPRGTTVTRDGDEATVRCVDTDQSWSLTCRGVRWLGVVGNCTIPKPQKPVVKAQQTRTNVQPEKEKQLLLPKDIIYLILACTTVFLSILTITTGYVCLKRAQILRRPPPKKDPEFKFSPATMTLIQAKSRPNSDYMTPVDVPDSQPDQSHYDTPRRNAPVVGAIPKDTTVKRNNEPDYMASTMSSTSTDYTRKYFVLDKDYVNPKDKDYVNPKDKDYVNPKDKDYVNPRDKDYVNPRDKDYVNPRDKDFVNPRDKDYVNPRDKDYVNPNDKDYVNPNDKEYVNTSDKDYVNTKEFMNDS